MCGGTASGAHARQRKTGLSPRVRGNHDGRQHGEGRDRSIPACAGEPRPPTSLSRVGAVYPRVCGGTRLHVHKLRHKGGLSPRVRGNRPGGKLLGFQVWSIPACAGEPLDDLGGLAHQEVYPRVCGGTGAGRNSPHRGEGLSPRVRGNPAATVRVRERAGSIPACAGEPRCDV